MASSLASAEVVPERIERRAKARGGRESSEAQHGVGALLHRPVAVLGAVVQVLAASVPDLPPEDPADRSAVGRMGIGRDALRLALGHVNESPQEAPRGVLVAVRAAHGVQEVALAVDGAVERAPAPGDLHVGLVQVPGAAGVAPNASLAAGPRAAGRSGPPRRGSSRA